MMFIYLFITALAAVSTGWMLRGARDRMRVVELGNEVDDQLAVILELKGENEKLVEIAAGRGRV